MCLYSREPLCLPAGGFRRLAASVPCFRTLMTESGIPSGRRAFPCTTAIGPLPLPFTFHTYPKLTPRGKIAPGFFIHLNKHCCYENACFSAVVRPARKGCTRTVLYFGCSHSRLRRVRHAPRNALREKKLPLTPDADALLHPAGTAFFAEGDTVYLWG